MYVCEECGTEDGVIEVFEDSYGVCKACAETIAGEPVELSLHRLGSKVVAASWIRSSYDGAPQTQAEVTAPSDVYRNGEE